MWRWGWRRKTKVHVLNHSFFPPRLFGWWGLIIYWRRVGICDCCHLLPWSPELSAQVRTVCVGLWLVAPPGLVRLSVRPSAEPWLLRHPGPGPGHLARAQQVPPAALEEQLPAEVPHQHWLLLETGAQSIWTLPGTWCCWLGVGALPSVSRESGVWDGE